MGERELTIEAEGLQSLGVRRTVWKKDGSVHFVADIYCPDFGAAEVYLPEGTDHLTGLRLAVMQDKAGHKRLTVRGI